MSVNIKSEHAHRVIRELAELTGESQTAAVTRAVEERLARLKEAKQAGLAERLLAIGKDTASRLRAAGGLPDHGDLLYGEDGLPR